MAKYKEDEQALYKLIKLRLYPDLEASKHKMTKWDCISHKDCVIMELKCRRTHYDTLRIEKIKYDALKKIAEQILYVPLYVNETKKGVYIFNLNEIKPVWTEQYNPINTSFGNGKMIKKVVYDIPITEAEMIFKKH